MFERYTEKARRVIFFGRYEASQYGSPYIETEHLLLGLLREDKALAARVLRSGSSVESIRKKIDEHTAGGTTFPTSVDLPLTNESKRVLAYAAEEAERLANRHIGTEHLLLGLMREKKSFAAQLLNEEGLILECTRENIADWQKRFGIDEGGGIEAVEIHGRSLPLGYVQARLTPLRKFAWRKRDWKALDVLVESGTDGIFFDVSVQDDPQFKTRGGRLDAGLVFDL